MILGRIEGGILRRRVMLGRRWMELGLHGRLLLIAVMRRNIRLVEVLVLAAIWRIATATAVAAAFQALKAAAAA